jgi:solute:Na+ symporter, SSS family
MLQLTIVIVYFIAVIAIGILSRRKHWGLDDFFVSGRRCSTLFVTGSLLATIIGGSATIGMAGLGFSRGLTGAWWILVGSVGLLILGLFLARRVREFGLYTLPGLAGKQYDSHVALAASILIVIAWLGVIAGQIIAAGKIFSALGIGSPQLWMIIFTLTFIFYVILGGQDAVIRTDILQVVIIYIGILAALGVTIWQTGGFGGLHNSIPADRFSFPLSSGFGVKELVTYLVIIGSTYIVGPDMYSRLFSSKDSRTARKSTFWAAALLVPLAFAITLIGMGALALFPDITAEQAFPTIIQSVFPPLVGGLVIAALISAVMSSADATVLSASVILTTDIIARVRPSLSEKHILLFSRIGVLVLGLVSLGLALVLKGVINALLFAYTIYTCGIILPIAIGFYKHKIKVTPAGALAAIIGGGLLGLASKIWKVPYLDLGAFFLSGILLLSVSFVDHKNKTRFQAGEAPAKPDES